MKSMITVLALSIASITAAMADQGSTKTVCSTTPTQFGATESITISNESPYFATLSGEQSGGMAHYIRVIGPVNVKITHEPDMTIYTNSEEGIELHVITMGVVGHLITTASFTEGRIPAVSMNCHFE